MKNKNIRNAKKKNYRYNLMITFLLTLVITMSIGMVCIFFIANKKENISVIDFLIKEKDILTKTIIDDENMSLADEPVDGWNIECADEDTISILFAGDVLLDDQYAIMSTYKQNGMVIENAFSQDLIEEMRKADIFMINNEFPFSDRGEALNGKTYTFRADTEYVSVLKDMGVDIVSLANNHAYDFGETAFLDTLDTLDESGIKRIGGGRNIDEASSTIYAYANGVKIAFLSATQIEKNPTPDTKGATDSTPGVFRCNTPDRLLEKITEAKENSDFVILYIHWGTESTTILDDLQKTQSQLYADAGADLVIGDHPHCLQQISYINDTPIFYSIGNYWFNSKTQDSCLVKITLDRSCNYQLQFIPCRQSGCKEQILHYNEKDAVLSYMRGLSAGVNISDEGYVTKK